MAPTVQALLIENNPADMANTMGFIEREAPHISVSVAKSLAGARDSLNQRRFDAVLLGHDESDAALLDFLRHLQREGIPIATIVLLNNVNYRLVSDLIEQGVAKTLIKTDGYWECLPALVRQAIENTRLLRAEQAAKLNLYQTLDALDEGIVLLDKESHIVYANKCILDVLGQTGEALIGQPVSKIAYANGQPLVKRYGRPIYGGEHNVTGYIEVYEAAHDLKADPASSPEVAQELERLRDQLMSRVSHEVKTPLTSILGFAHMMLTRPDAALEKREKWATFIHSKSELLNRLIDNMLELSNLKIGQVPLKFRDADLIALMQNAVSEMEVHAPGRQYNLQIPAQIPEISLDTDHISQVLVNLMTYAHNASPPETPIDVQVTELPDVVQIAIRDYGHSIEPQARESVFEPFSAEPGAGLQPGKGLWLPVARAIVEAHGGRMQVEGEPTGGNTFFISLPKRKSTD